MMNVRLSSDVLANFIQLSVTIIKNWSFDFFHESVDRGDVSWC